MKIERDFAPVTIRFESVREMNFLYQILMIAERHEETRLKESELLEQIRLFRRDIGK